ncbi:hypothetical protein C8R42DRAFT_131237 [Lentinula raphanica]|nr:hypothetical protein C8R42DRAFT_131237 [Lentinula raphanica]
MFLTQTRRLYVMPATLLIEFCAPSVVPVQLPRTSRSCHNARSGEKKNKNRHWKATACRRTRFKSTSKNQRRNDAC